MRKGLIVLLSLGVVVGFGSGFARIAHRGGGCHERWGNEYDGREGRYDRFDRYDRNERFERDPAPVAAPVAAAPAPVYIVIPQPAAQAAPPAECEAICAHHRPVRLSWARLLKRVLATT